MNTEFQRIPLKMNNKKESKQKRKQYEQYMELEIVTKQSLELQEKLKSCKYSS
jgi:hypothetical protein